MMNIEQGMSNVEGLPLLDHLFRRFLAVTAHLDDRADQG
jgi:hypothetical protein